MGTRFVRELPSACPPRSVAQLAAVGVSPAMIRGSQWRRSSRGFYVPADAAITPTKRIVELSPLVPAGGAITGWSAAYALGVDLLDGLDAHTMAPQPATVLLGNDIGRSDLPLVRFRRAALNSAETISRHGLVLSTPSRTWAETVLETHDLVEAVVATDMVMAALGLEQEALTQWCVNNPRFRGMHRLGLALAWSDPLSASPWETRLRLFYRRQAGLPKPLVNQPIFDLEERFLGAPDLFDPEAGLATEFDGRDHRKRRQHRADNLREEGLEVANLVVCRVDSLDFRSPVPLIERLRTRYEQGLRRDRRQDAWTLNQPEWWKRRRAS